VGEIGRDHEVARINNLGWWKESDAASGTFALDADLARTNKFRRTLTGLWRAIRDSDLITAAGNYFALAVYQAADDVVSARREEIRLPTRRIGHATPAQVIRQHIAATVRGSWSWKINECARSELGLLAPDHDVARTDDLDTVRGTTPIDNHIPTTRARS
jgi:hypothetical protein